MVQVRVEIRLKKGVTDPEGDNVQKALNLLGFKGVRSVRSSKLFLIDLQTKDARAARKEVEASGASAARNYSSSTCRRKTPEQRAKKSRRCAAAFWRIP